MNNEKSLQYNFKKLVEVHPYLSSFLKAAPAGHQTIDFSDPLAVKALNKAILLADYGIPYWDIPKGKLIPAVPGRLKYLEGINALFIEQSRNKSTKRILDIGVGANVIYPLLGKHVYRWSFVGSEVDKSAFANAKNILAQNSIKEDYISVRFQKDNNHIFKGVIMESDYFDAVICNPPFYDIADDPQSANAKKNRKLEIQMGRNFAGELHEIAYPGGELAFISQMIEESKQFSTQVFYFTTLVSQQKNLRPLTKILDQIHGIRHGSIDISTANKKSRFIYWSYLTDKQQKAWANYRWQTHI